MSSYNVDMNTVLTAFNSCKYYIEVVGVDEYGLATSFAQGIDMGAVRSRRAATRGAIITAWLVTRMGAVDVSGSTIGFFEGDCSTPDVFEAVINYLLTNILPNAAAYFLMIDQGVSEVEAYYLTERIKFSIGNIEDLYNTIKGFNNTASNGYYFQIHANYGS